MKKIKLTAILTAIVLVVGMFAFAPQIAIKSDSSYVSTDSWMKTNSILPAVWAEDDDDDACDSTVTDPSSIQAAVDAASPGDVVCLDDSGGDFTDQTVVFGPEDSGITLRNEPGDSPVLRDATLNTGSVFGIELLSGVSDVIIEGFTIKDYMGSGSGSDRSSAIVAADGPLGTSEITVRDMELLDNQWNGILVFSEGDFIHKKWTVYDNKVSGNGFVGVELTNCNHCSIEENDIDGPGLFGVVVQARNTIAGSGLVSMGDVEVSDNTVDGTSLFGIYVLSFTGDRNTFAPIAGASSLLKDVSVEENIVTDVTGTGIRLWAFNAAASNIDAEIEENTVNCLTPIGTHNSIQVIESGAGPGTVRDVELDDNTIDSDCIAILTDPGTTED